MKTNPAAFALNGASTTKKIKATSDHTFTLGIEEEFHIIDRRCINRSSSFRAIPIVLCYEPTNRA
jgi:hypothetical protein